MNFMKLSGNQLKIIAAVAMTIDHIGALIFPQVEILRIIGRIAMPIFAYMIAEGCEYTKSRAKYLVTILAMAGLCQIVYYFAENSLKQCILVTFSMSVILIYAYDFALKKKNIFPIGLCLGLFFIACQLLPKVIKGFHIDYGFAGVILPLLIYAGRNKKEKLILFLTGVVILALYLKGVQVYGILTLPLIMMYSGERGKWKMKYFFYIYYPLHLLILNFISSII